MEIEVKSFEKKQGDIKKITDKIKEYDDAEWKLTPNGSLKLGNITLQRKGGSGQPDNIQFKIKIPGIKD